MSLARAVDYKAAGGKLVRIRLMEYNGKIASIRISGDFFLVPEESLSLLEGMLEGLPLREEDVRARIDYFFKASGVKALGISQDDLVTALLSVKEEVVTI